MKVHYEFAVLCSCILFASDFAKCQTILNGHKNYTTIMLGNINILISAPHGGDLRPNDIENRSETTLGDYNTFQLATEIKNNLANLFGSNSSKNYLPFLVFNNLHRYVL